MNWWSRLTRRKQIEEQLDKELRFHLDQHANELIARGLSPGEARRRARLALGGPRPVAMLAVLDGSRIFCVMSGMRFGRFGISRRSQPLRC